MAVEGNKLQNRSVVSKVVTKYSDLGSGASCYMGANSFLLHFIYYASVLKRLCAGGKRYVCILKKERDVCNLRIGCGGMSFPNSRVLTT